MNFWHDDNNDLLKIFEIINECGTEFPMLCTACGEKTAHVYMHRYDERNHGGLWVWCSNCHRYSHTSCLVPEWWRNNSLFSITELKHTPDTLNERKVYIDDFVNKLIAIRDDKLFKSASDPIPCEKCGTNMIRKFPEGIGGCYSIICPKCGWGCVTSYFDPIVKDPAEYEIVLLEGNKPSNEVIRAVNQVSHRNLLKSKQLIENAPQVIFKGDALEVHGMKKILDEESIRYIINPDFLYD